MLLSEVTKGFDGELVRDGILNGLNFCTETKYGPFLTFMEKESFLPKLISNAAVSCVICRPDLATKIPENMGLFVADEPKQLFEEIHNKLSTNKEYCLPEHPTVIGNNCDISPLAYIADKNVIIGNNVKVGPFAYIGEHVEIGDNCEIYNHASLGGKAFSCARVGNEGITVMKDCGKVVLEEGVVVMGHTHIARGVMPTEITYIGKNSVFDAHVHIGHGTKMKERVFIAAGAMLSGHVEIGKDAWIGINAVISNRIVIGDRCRISIGAVATKDVPDDTTVTGNFAVEHSRFIAELRERNLSYHK